MLVYCILSIIRTKSIEQRFFFREINRLYLVKKRAEFYGPGSSLPHARKPGTTTTLGKRAVVKVLRNKLTLNMFKDPFRIAQ